MTIAKYESLLRAEYEAAVEKGRAVYPPEKLLTPGPEILAFVGTARVALSEVHIGRPVTPSESEGPGREGGTKQMYSNPTRPDPLLMLGMTVAGDFTELRIHASQSDRYANRLPDFATDVVKVQKEGKQQVFFAATKGGAEKVERLLKEFE